MPKPTKNLPETIRPFVFHGLDLRLDGREAKGDCPFCGREDKLSVNIETTKWRCFVCGETGNQTSYLERLWNLSFEATTVDDYSSLAVGRGLLFPESLVQWGVARSIATLDWLVPGFTPEGKLATLYRYINGKLLPTPTRGHHLHGTNLWSSDKGIVDICEGPWDGIAYWESLAHARVGENDRLVPCHAPEDSLLADINVVAVPGCQTFMDSWLDLFEGKVVRLLYDNDHPRTHPQTGAAIPPAGYAAMERVAKMLSSHSRPPHDIYFHAWGPEGFDESLESGHDLRDELNR